MAVKEFERLQSALGVEFDRYVREHDAFADKIPRGALVIIQVEGNEPFNKWARDITREGREKGQPIVYVHVKGLKPRTSRLIDPVIKKIA